MVRSLRVAKAVAMVGVMCAPFGCGGAVATGQQTTDGEDGGGDGASGSMPCDLLTGPTGSSKSCSTGEMCAIVAGSYNAVTCTTPTSSAVACGAALCDSEFCSCHPESTPAVCDCYLPVEGPLPPPDLPIG